MDRILTVGHSNQSIEAFIGLLGRHEVMQVADVRRYPSSRRWPQFNGGSLAASLAGANIRYQHHENLGGKRDSSAESKRHPGLENPWQRDYAAYMNTPGYRRALAQLVDWSRQGLTAVMCAEASPDHCHRRLLSDALLQSKVEVTHLLPGSTKAHRPHPALRLEGDFLVYDQGVLPLEF